MLHKILFFSIIFLALFGGGIISLGAPSYFSYFIDIMVVIFFIFSLFARATKGLPIPHLWHIIFCFLGISLFSIYVNDYPATRSIFSLRLLFRFYIFYIAVILMRPDDDLIKSFNWFLGFLLVMQFPVVAYKFAQYGIAERTHGAYAVHDGSIATTLPISFIFFLAAFYFLYKPKIRYILIGIGYICLSIVGDKRAVFFLYPFQFMAIFYYIYVKETGADISKKLMALAMVIPVIVVLSGAILFFNKTLNPDREVGGRIDLSYALEYAHQYNIGIDGYGYSYGRIATTQRVIEILVDRGFKHVLFGVGPGATIPPASFESKKEREVFNKQYDAFKIGYGFTTISTIALEYGLTGVIIFSMMLFVLTRMCLRLYQKETDPYWRAFGCGAVWFSFSIVFFAFSYHQSLFLGDTMPVLYFYVMAVVYTRYYHRSFPEKKPSASRFQETERQPVIA